MKNLIWEEFSHSFCVAQLSPLDFKGYCYYRYGVGLGGRYIVRSKPWSFTGRCNQEEVSIERYGRETGRSTAYCVDQNIFADNPNIATMKQFAQSTRAQVAPRRFPVGISGYALISNIGVTASIKAKRLSIDALTQRPNEKVIVSSRYSIRYDKAHYTDIPDTNNALRAEASIEDMVHGKIFLTTISG